MFGVWNPFAGFGVFLPVLSAELGWSRGAISAAASLNLIIGGVIAFVVGAATDRYGPRQVLVLSGLLVGAGYLIASAVSALWQFYLSLGLLLGVGMSGMYVVPTATVSRWFVEQRGLALGVVLAGLSFAYVTGGPLTAFCINTFGWRTAYLLMGGLVWAVAVPASLFMINPPSGHDFRSGAGGAPHGAASSLGAQHRLDVTGATLREALKDRRLWFFLVAWLLLGFTLIMVTVHLVPYMTDQGVALERASLALTIYGISSIAGRLAFGLAADRLGTRPTFWFCLVAQLLPLTAVLAGPPPWVLYLLIIGFGLGAAGSDTAVVKGASEVFGVRAIGAIMGVLALGWRCGAALGPAAAGFLYDLTGSYSLPFGLASAGLLVSFACFTLGTSPPRS